MSLKDSSAIASRGVGKVALEPGRRDGVHGEDTSTKCTVPFSLKAALRQVSDIGQLSVARLGQHGQQGHKMGLLRPVELGSLRTGVPGQGSVSSYFGLYFSGSKFLYEVELET
ncbi:hypothetical protein PABG_12139 [Paracoccidioides brasiliensis Pb03]|nr:hypothetical protein PABG_12139 [Paracoccidioides brasiliensis Pb03]